MKRYEIWQAKVKFEDSDEVKNRPVLIWNNQAYVIVAYKMTGTNRGDDYDEYRIKYWAEAGLTKPTSVRISKMLRLQPEDMLYKIGELDKRERLLFDFRLV